MDTAITINTIIANLETIIVLVAGIGAIVALYKYLIGNHERVTKWDKYEGQIKSIKNEQEILTTCMEATLDGLKQLGCNGKVTEASEKLKDYLIEQAHQVD